jgi:hypothetical protein
MKGIQSGRGSLAREVSLVAIGAKRTWPETERIMHPAPLPALRGQCHHRVSQGRAPLSQTESAKDSGHYLWECRTDVRQPTGLGEWISLERDKQDLHRYSKEFDDSK